MMKVITKTPNEYGSYGALMEYDGVMLPENFLEVPDWVNTEEFVEYEGFVFLEALRGCAIAMRPNLEAWEKWQEIKPPDPEPEPTLEERVKALEDTQVGQDDLDAMWTQMADAVREGVNEV